MAPSKAAFPRRPYRGLNFFTRADAPLLSLREAEVRDCVTILGHPTTRVLILHGRTAAGKSSFLRAGLVPALEAANSPGEEANFNILPLVKGSSDPKILRCADRPILQLCRSLAWYAASSANSDCLPEDTRTEIAELFYNLIRHDPRSCADRLLKALLLISATSRQTLALFVDQTEEILTLNPDRNNLDRLAFFYFLEQVCLTPIDLKIVLAIRTEYYGSFCDQFRIAPALRIAPFGRSGLEQYMLHTIRDDARLAKAILAPTQGEAASFYGFTFTEGVAEAIAKDIVSHSGESSTLPILQIVCQDLHETVVLRARRSEITLADYQSKGRVQGRLDSYIGQSILLALRRNGFTGKHLPADTLRLSWSQSLFLLFKRKKWFRRQAHVARLVDSWRLVLCEFIGTQEGGSITTLIRSESDIKEIAAKLGIDAAVGQILDDFTRDSQRLLRKLPNLSTFPGAQNDIDSGTNYSLAHDTLAVALARWQTANESAQNNAVAVRRQIKKIKTLAIVSAVILSGASLAFAGLVLFDSIRRQEASNASVVALTTTSRSPDFRLKLLFILRSISASNDPLLSAFVNTQQLYDALRSVLLRSPTYGGSEIGGSQIGLVAVESTNNLVSAYTMDGTVWTLPQGSITFEDIGKADGSVSSSLPAAMGYLKGIDGPVITMNGKVFYWLRGQRHEFPLSDVLSPGFANSWVFFNNGQLRLVEGFRADTTIGIVDAQIQDGEARFSAPEVVIKFPKTDSRLPTYSDYSTRFAQFVGNAPAQCGRGAEHAQIMRIDDGSWSLYLRTGPVPQSGSADSATTEIRSEFLQSIGFADTGSIAVRASADELYLYRSHINPCADPIIVAVPNGFGESLSAAQYLRPPLAVFESAGSWKLAWMLSSGMYVIDVDEASRSATSSRVFLTGTTDASSLLFSGDGSHIFQLWRSYEDGNAQFWVYDLSSERRNMVASMSIADLVIEACRVASLVAAADRNELLEGQMLPVNETDPCSEE